MRTNSHPHRRALPARALTLTLLLLPFGAPAGALPLPGLDLDLVWDASFVLPPGEFVYRYSLTDLRGEPRLVRVILAEDQDGGHAGLHDEFAIVIPAGASFQRDGFLVNFPTHNYDWDQIPIPANGSVTFGFTDTAHGPHAEDLRIVRGEGIVTVFGMPVPGLHLWELSLQPDGNDPNRIKAFRDLGATSAQLGPNLWQYKHFLRNTGNVPIGDQNVLGGPCPNDATISPVNYVDFYVSEHPTHRSPRGGLHDEIFNLPDNALAKTVREDSPGHGAFGLPAGIRRNNYAFEEIGNGPAMRCWMPGETLTLGWTDPHGPGQVPTGGRVVGSDVEGFFGEGFQLVAVPATPAIIPTQSSLGLVILGLVLLLGGLAVLRLRRRFAGGG